MQQAKQPFEQKPEESSVTYPKTDGEVTLLTLELDGLPPHVDEGQVKRDLFQGQHVVRFDTVRDNLSGRCKGRGTVQVRCARKEEGDKLVERLAQAGVAVKVGSMRNLRREGPTTKEVAANPCAHHIATKDLDEQVKNQWLNEMKKQNERKEKLLKEVRQRVKSTGLLYAPIQGGAPFCQNSTMRLVTDSSTAAGTTPYNQTASTPLLAAQ